MRMFTVRFFVASPLVIALWVAAANAQPQSPIEGVAVHTFGDVGTVTMTPPSIVEDNAAVTARLLANPVQQVWALPTLLEDHVGPPELNTGFVDVSDWLDTDGEYQSRGLLEGWNCGGTNILYPPDPIMAAGPTKIIVANNYQFIIYDKATASSDFVSTWAAFFSEVIPAFTGTTDPKVLYDHETGRWFLMILGIRGSDLYSWYLLAVSDDSDPNGTWMKYALDSTLNGGTPTDTWSDYPGMGICSDALYITANMYSRSVYFFQYAKLRIFSKQTLLNFDPTVTWSDIWNINDPGGGKAFTIQPTQHWGTPQAPFLVDTNPPNRISVFGVNDPLGSPSLSGTNVTVNSYSTPPDAEQPGGDPLLDTIDTRVYNAVWRNNFLYFAHNRARSASAGAKWYIVETTNWPTLGHAEGSIGDNMENMWFPSVAVNQYDTLAIGFCRSSTVEYASIYYWYRQADGTISDPLLIKAGTAHYTGEAIGTPGEVVRWGDYTGTVVDPVDDTSFWHYNEYPNPNSPTKWRTWVQKFTVDEPPTGCPSPGSDGDYCTADIYPNNGDGVWTYPAVDGDCVIDLFDLAELLGGYGITTGATREDGDVYPPLTGDGAVDLFDLAEMMGQYGDDCN